MLLLLVVSVALIVTILLSIEVGYRIGSRRWSRISQQSRNANTTLEASVFGLTGLLIGFVFYGAGTRFEARRGLIAQEANAIGTAYLRIDLLPPSTQPALREDFRKYLRSRLEVYRDFSDMESVRVALDRSQVIQKQVWKDAVAATQQTGPAEKSLVVTSLNEMIDVTTLRTVALTAHPPPLVFIILALSTLISSVLSGYTMAAAGIRDWTFMIAFAFVFGIAICVILDYEFPRIGLIRIDPIDQVLLQTLENMN